MITTSSTQTFPSPSTSESASATACDEQTRLAIADARIMIIDDEPLNVEVVREFLSLDGYKHFTTTNDPIEALTKLGSAAPDLVLLDIQMPGLNGLDLLRAIRAEEEFRTLPVVILTAATDDETRMQALERGATDFLAKPVNQHELTARVRNMLTVKVAQDRLVNYSRQLEERVRQRTAALEESRWELIRCLARAAEFRDDDTGEHIVRVGRYVRIIAEEMGFAAHDLDLLEAAAQLHDIGKIGIPDAVLLKEGKLNDDEYDIIKRHCGFGRKIIAPMGPEATHVLRGHAELGSQILGETKSDVIDLAREIALTHHERWDGSGYPLGLAGEDIPLSGRITAVADVFDALSSRRPYKQPFPLDKCFAILQSDAGTHFDPDCVTAFLARKDLVIRTQIQHMDME